MLGAQTVPLAVKTMPGIDRPTARRRPPDIVAWRARFPMASEIWAAALSPPAGSMAILTFALTSPFLVNKAEEIFVPPTSIAPQKFLVSGFVRGLRGAETRALDLGPRFFVSAIMRLAPSAC